MAEEIADCQKTHNNKYGQCIFNTKKKASCRQNDESDNPISQLKVIIIFNQQASTLIEFDLKISLALAFVIIVNVPVFPF
jgi:hypothetical protein